MAIANQILNSQYIVYLNGNGTVGEIHSAPTYTLYWN
jgi:hypothetical protein